MATPGVYTSILRDNLAYSAQGEMNYEIRLTSLQLALRFTDDKPAESLLSSAFKQYLNRTVSNWNTHI